MHPADSDHQFDPALAALHAILITLRDQACENAILRAHLVALGQALYALAESPAEELSRTDDPQTIPTAAAGSTSPPPTDPVPAPSSITTPPATAATASEPRTPASNADLERLRQHWNGRGEDSVPVTSSAPPAPPTAAPPPDDQELLYALSTCCAHHAAVIQHLRDQDHTPGVPLPPCDPDAAALVEDRCHRWEEIRRFHTTMTLDDWDALAGSYTTVATMTETLAQVLDDPALSTYRISGLELAAEVRGVKTYV
jgi:hypothetical protein